MELGWFARMLNTDVDVLVDDGNGNVLFKGTVQQIMEGFIARDVFCAKVVDWKFHEFFPFVAIKVKCK